MDVLGVHLEKLSVREIISRIESYVQDSSPHHIVTINPEYLVESFHNDRFRDVLNHASLATIDGIGVLVAYEYLRNRGDRRDSLAGGFLSFFKAYFRVIRSEEYSHIRLSGVDLIWLLTQQEFMHHRKVYLLGGREYVATQAAKRLEQCNSNIIYKSSNGLDSVKSPDPRQNEYILRDINDFSPDVLLVAYGHPWQDLWISQHISHLPVRVAIGVGGSFDYIAGRAVRAPRWMRVLGLEWLYRFAREPRRFFRICNATFVFVRRVIES